MIAVNSPDWSLPTEKQRPGAGRFHELAVASFQGKKIPPKKTGDRPTMDWDACLSSMAAEKNFRDEYFAAFSRLYP